jgi:nitrogen fixation protein FixH
MGLPNLFHLDDRHPFTGWHMLAVTVGFFAVIIAVNIALAVAASGTFPGLVVENSYVASQNYNELLAEARAQAKTGWQLQVTVHNGVPEARLVDQGGLPLVALDVRALAARPSTTAEDRSLTFTAVPGAYRADASLPAGQWALDVEARSHGELVFREVRRIFIASDGSGG